jgi:hypothetical protein
VLERTCTCNLLTHKLVGRNHQMAMNLGPHDLAFPTETGLPTPVCRHCGQSPPFELSGFVYACDQVYDMYMHAVTLRNDMIEVI